MFNKRYGHLSWILLGIFSLSSCVDIETNIELTREGSGTLELTYTVASLLVQMGPESRAVFPLPISEADFRQTVARIPGLTLRSYERKDEPEKSTIKARLGFSNLSDVNELFGGAEPVVTQSTEGNDSVVEILVSPGTAGGLDPRTRELINTFFPNYSLRFTIKTPSVVKRTSIPQSSIQGNVARLTLPILQALDRDSPLTWKIYW